MLGGFTAASAQTAAPSKDAGTTAVGEVIVTANKRSESIQKVAASIQALDTRKLDELNVTEFNDYVKYLPSVSIQSAGPNAEEIYFRGIADGEDGNHSGPLPSVGVYLDETPITTIGGTLDIHVYDIARVEALAGPQGTLYGASSESGTLRLITNKPSTAAFSAGFDVQGNTVDHGGQGYVYEGFVNIPITSNVAVRLVGWDEYDAGYINNVYGERTFATSGDTINNASLVKKDFNGNHTFGGRAALKWDIDSNWSVTPMLIAQETRNTGTFGYEPAVGDLEVQRFQPDTYHDQFLMAALTVAGKIGKFDVVYSGSEFTRKVNSQSDYSDYSVFYDGVYGSGANWLDGNGNPIANPSQEIVGTDHYTKESHELRISSPSTDRFRIIAGLFEQRQTHWIIQDYLIQGLGSQLTVPGWNNTYWLTDQMRIDRDAAAFTEMSFDVTDHLTLNGGVRVYDYDNTLKGFYGFSEGTDQEFIAEEGLVGPFGPSNPGPAGMSNCFSSQTYRGDPCINLDKKSTGSGETHKINLTYKFDANKLVYFTYSTGYRPGGINRNGALGPYAADSLSNYELGWKTTWMNHRLTLNGALFYEDWSNMQFSYLGQYSLTVVANAGEAVSKGIESDFNYRVTNHFNLSGAVTYTDARLVQDYCQSTTLPCNAANAANNPIQAPAGTKLPVTPQFKGDLIARYTWDVLNWKAHAQGVVSYVGERNASLLPSQEYSSPGVQGIGGMPAYATLDLAFGVEKNGLGLELFIKNVTDERGQVSRSATCNTCQASAPGLPPPAIYVVPIQPLTAGLKLSKKF
jgi:outer membrane receptor protein involved in Fe transport